MMPLKKTDIARLNSSIVVLCVDLQQVLFCPTLTHSNTFYQRQLSNYNFAIHNEKFLSTGQSFSPCDRDFALIEKQKKKSKVLVPSQWKYFIANAR